MTVFELMERLTGIGASVSAEGDQVAVRFSEEHRRQVEGLGPEIRRLKPELLKELNDAGSDTLFDGFGSRLDGEQDEFRGILAPAECPARTEPKPAKAEALRPAEPRTRHPSVKLPGPTPSPTGSKPTNLLAGTLAPAQCPPLPPGVRLVRYAPKTAPVDIAPISVVNDVDKFIRSYLRDLHFRLEHPKAYACAPLYEILAKLAEVGVELEIDAGRQG